MVSKGSPSVWIRLKEEKGNYTRSKDGWGLWQLADADGEKRRIRSDRLWSGGQMFTVASTDIRLLDGWLSDLFCRGVSP